MNIRLAEKYDHNAIWEIFSAVVSTGDTYMYSPESKRDVLDNHWLAPNMKTYVLEDEDEILGTYFLRANQPDLGAHVANAGYMIRPKAQGKGLGKALCEHSIQCAKRLSYRSIQFNCVVSTNTAAIKLWEKFGFKIIGTSPKAFKHKTLGLVDTHIMYLSLD